MLRVPRHFCDFVGRYRWCWGRLLLSLKSIKQLPKQNYFFILLTSLSNIHPQSLTTSPLKNDGWKEDDPFLPFGALCTFFRGTLAVKQLPGSRFSLSGGRLWRPWETHCGGDHQAGFFLCCFFVISKRIWFCFSLKIWNLISIIINLSCITYKSRFFVCNGKPY